MQQYDSFDQLDPAVRADLARWMLTIADNKQLLGFRYAEWCVGAPELEADVAISAIAQYELGHARLLNGQLARMQEDPRGDDRSTSPGAWTSMAALDRPAADWTELIAINGLIDNMLTVNLAAATAGGLRPLARRLSKAVSEEHYHSLHARAWFDRLLGGPAEIVERLNACVEEIWPQCIAWFGPEKDNALDRLASAGVLDAGAAELRDRFLEVTDELIVSPLGVPAERQESGWKVLAEIAWEGWNPTSRRHGVPEIDAESFSVLSGEYARELGVAD
jgi:phenylacetate-CoA oxygenase PaaI subunit